MSGIDEFMAAITAQESGGRPQVANKKTGAHGLFQIMPGNWSPWAKEAGLGGNASKTPENQTKVARHKMQQYYDQYGSWDLVAAAWFGGPGAANALKRGDRSVLNRSDGNMTIGEYIKKMNKGMGSRVSSGSSGDDRLASTAKAVSGGVPGGHGYGDPQQGDPAQLWSTILSTLADQTAGGQREALDAEPASVGSSLGAAAAMGGAGGADSALAATSARWLPEGPSEEEIGEAEPIDGEEPPPSSGSDGTSLGDLGDVTPGRNGIPPGLKSNAARGAAAARRVFGFKGEIGGIGQRANRSDHPHGNAIDLMTNDDIEQGRKVTNFFLQHREALGVKYVIFDRTIWSAKNGWKPRRMEDRGSDTANHRDHPHVSFV